MTNENNQTTMNASRDWHTMNSLVCEISRVSREIEDALVHKSLNKFSNIKSHIDVLCLQRDAFYAKLYDHTGQWLQKLKTKGEPK
jgi:hypothetical protein